jgi:hypothetical protein
MSSVAAKPSFNFPVLFPDYVIGPNNLFVSCGIMCGAAKR